MVVLALLVAACGGDSADDPPTESPSEVAEDEKGPVTIDLPTATPEPTATPTPTATATPTPDGGAGTEIDAALLASQIEQGILDQTGVVATVTCPEGIVAATGDTWTCEAVADNGETGVITITATSDDGDVNWEVTETSSPDMDVEGPQTASVFELTVGQCFNSPDTPQVQDVELLPCDQPHQAEVYSLPQYPAGPDEPYPGDDVVRSWAENQCVNVDFATYVGVPFGQSALGASWLTPTQGSWENSDDREVICVLIDANGGQLTGSKFQSGE